ncbi:folylpolyglutamate synthase, mitochondrial-like [Drosophila pseudoobscura]|uniref:Folylpolyglutamate synthase, mitochondrial-like n=1 Tax=Drosophila pseudoobscura pseudoobscura TaxID=46245 RepID=A0A6I8W5Z3_DROPS|nr:folylpolyglutamate synthase, mitochondrial [Drosophila pseudoobscura]
MISLITTMTKVRRAGPTVWQGTAHASNKFFKGSKPQQEQEPESSEAQPSVPGDTNPEGKRGNTGSTGNPGNSRYPLAGHKKPSSALSFSDQRAKWRKYSAEMQLKAKLAAQGGVKPDKGVVDIGVGVGVGPSMGPTPGKSNWQQQQQSMQNKAEGDNETKGSSAEDQRKSWMNRMHGSHKNQAELLKQLSAKQQAGRDLQLKKMQQVSKASAAATAASVGANKSAAGPQEPEEQAKSPERMAYLEAVRRLNIFHSFEPVLGRMRSKMSKAQVDPFVEHTLELLHKMGVSKEQLESIPVIQVAGSKGKATTCGIVQNILMAHGIKTGLLCSPHLIYSYERIRITGEPLSEAQFTELVHKIYPELADMDPTPAHSQILTAMAFRAFRDANVDVAIVEVGRGGASDSTNITLHAKTIGISTLGWEQGSNLSESMRDIAWAKGEIMKPAATIFTNVSQPECCEVLAQKAKQMGAKLHRVPTFNALTEANPSHKRFLTKANHSVKLNASLATQLAYDYLRRHKPEFVVGLNLDLDPKCTQLTQAAMRGLETFESVGHFDIVKHDMYNVYLDTADSVESMMVCREWFYTLTRSRRVTKILLYNKTSDSNAKDLLTILRFNVNFDEAHFVPCPNFSEGEILPDEEWHVMEEMQRAKRSARTWRGLCEETGKKDTSQTSASVNAFFEHVQAKYGNQKFGMKSEVDVLVTGSRPLVAATITMLNKMRGFPG